MPNRSYPCLEFWLRFPEEMDKLSENDWRDKDRFLPEPERKELEKKVEEVGNKAIDEAHGLLVDIRNKFKEIIDFDLNCKSTKGSSADTIRTEWYFHLPLYPGAKSTKWKMLLSCTLYGDAHEAELVALLWCSNLSGKQIKDELGNIVVDSSDLEWAKDSAVIGRAALDRKNFEWDSAINAIVSRVKMLSKEKLDRLDKLCG